SRHDAPGPDDRLRADLHARADDRTTADPNIRPDLDRFGELLLSTQFGVHRMSGRVDLHRRSELSTVADLHQAYVEDDAVEVEENSFPQQDVRAVVAEEWRLHPDRFPALADKLLQDGSAVIL